MCIFVSCITNYDVIETQNVIFRLFRYWHSLQSEPPNIKHLKHSNDSSYARTHFKQCRSRQARMDIGRNIQYNTHNSTHITKPIKILPISLGPWALTGNSIVTIKLNEQDM